MDATVCPTCTSMLTHINTQPPVYNSHRQRDWAQVPQFVQLCHYKLDRIWSSAASGCPLCSKLASWILKHGGQKEHVGLDFAAEPNASDAGVWKFRFGVSDGDGEQRSNDSASKLLVFTAHPLEMTGLNEACYTGFSKANEDSLKHTGSPATLSRANRWLQKCLQEHPSCSAGSDESVYPPRLLDLRGGRVRLVGNTAGLKGVPYAALSHSWGPSPQQLLLTTENQLVLADDISDAQLPPTFRHAIIATRAFGLDYLWIDSLCIIQAGEAHVGDWLGHSAIMGSIYQNCTINIAAAQGRNANAGCFVDRNVSEIAPCILNLRKVTRIGDPKQDDFTVDRQDVATPHLLVSEPLLSENVAHFHLDSRAWVCQERLLSPRTIYFTETQYFWECLSSQNVSESVPEGVSASILPKPDEFLYMGDAIGQDFSWGTMTFDSAIPPYSWKAPAAKDQYEWWLKTLHGYVKRNLTKSSDKLPAIGGIAERTAAVLGDEYLAGLFKNKLPDALLWSRVQERRPRYPKDASEFFAPSWSWASLNGSLDFTPLSSENARTLCTLISSHTTLADPSNRYGQVRSASLTLHGPFLTFPLTLLRDDKNWVYHFAQLHVKGFASKKQLLYFDFDPCTLSCEQLGLLVVRENARPPTYPGSGDMEEAGLIVAPAAEEGATATTAGDGRKKKWYKFGKDQDVAQATRQWIRIGVWKGVEYDFDETKKFKYRSVAELVIV